MILFGVDRSAGNHITRLAQIRFQADTTAPIVPIEKARP
jgi:hypothetical protein